WHKEHFQCYECAKNVCALPFYADNDKIYCEEHYPCIGIPVCAMCQKEINGVSKKNFMIMKKCVSALGKEYHPEHFTCTICGKVFLDGEYLERDGKPYCEQDYKHLFTKKCDRCGNPIHETSINALNKFWHQKCFNCEICKISFDDSKFFSHQEKPYCQEHYHLMKGNSNKTTIRGTICCVCKKGIVGKCITAQDRKYHPEHFTCSHCSRVLANTSFKEHSFKPYCVNCFNKLF
ncbi:LIM domain protein, partial [Rozella allomycis CSF55]